MENNYEGKAQGGYVQSQKVYYCEHCESIGRGAKMISHHLEGCMGQGRRTRKSTEELKHRKEEAIMNTKEWEANRHAEEAKIAFNEMRDVTLQHIQELRDINSEVMHEIVEAYFKRIF